MGLREETSEVNRTLKPTLHLGSGATCALPGRQDHRPAPSQPNIGTSIRRPPWVQPAIGTLLIGLQILAATITLPAQDERRTRVPVLGKIGGGTTHQAFSGKVQSVDLKRNLLKVNTVEGNATEFFPIKKNVPISTASGDKMKAQDLAPGTTIIVYYDQKEDRRTVSQIMVLSSGGEEKEGKAEKEKKKSPPPS